MTRKAPPKTATAPTNSKTHRETPEGPEKHCSRCNEWWPANTDFFFSDSSTVDGLFYACKACYREGLGKKKVEPLNAAPTPVALACVAWLGSQRLPATHTARTAA